MRAEGTTTPFSSRTVIVGAGEVCAAAVHSRAKSIHQGDTESRRILLIIELAVVRIEQAWPYVDYFTVGCESGRVGFSQGETDRNPTAPHAGEMAPEASHIPGHSGCHVVPASYWENRRI